MVKGLNSEFSAFPDGARRSIWQRVKLNKCYQNLWRKRNVHSQKEICICWILASQLVVQQSYIHMDTHASLSAYEQFHSTYFRCIRQSNTHKVTQSLRGESHSDNGTHHAKCIARLVDSCPRQGPACAVTNMGSLITTHQSTIPRLMSWLSECNNMFRPQAHVILHGHIENSRYRTHLLKPTVLPRSYNRSRYAQVFGQGGRTEYHCCILRSSHT